MDQLTPFESDLYSRQLYIHGLEGQRRLKRAVIGIDKLEGVNVEILKNISLAGVKDIYIFDDQLVSEQDVNSNFFLALNSVGLKRIDAAASKLCKLNELVRVHLIDADLMSLVRSNTWHESYLSVHIVCSTSREFSELEVLNNFFRPLNVSMLATQCLGLMGYILVDFGLHSFVRGTQDEDTTTFSYPPLSIALSSVDIQSPRVLQIIKAMYLNEPQDSLSAQEASLLQLYRRIASLMPTVAILGGLAANEVLKYFTKREPTIFNCLVLEATGETIVVSLPSDLAPTVGGIIEELDLTFAKIN